MMSSLMGATAFQKGLGVVHSCAHPLSTKYDTHHGLANAIMLPFGVEFNFETSKEKYQALAHVVGAEDFAAWTKELSRSLGLPTSLKEIGVTEEGVDDLVELAMADPCHGNNPRPCAKEDFRALYLKALK